MYKVLENAKKDEGLYYNYINPNTGQWCASKFKAISFSFKIGLLEKPLINFD